MQRIGKQQPEIVVHEVVVGLQPLGSREGGERLFRPAIPLLDLRKRDEGTHRQRIERMRAARAGRCRRGALVRL